MLSLYSSESFLCCVSMLFNIMKSHLSIPSFPELLDFSPNFFPILTSRGRHFPHFPSFRLHYKVCGPLCVAFVTRKDKDGVLVFDMWTTSFSSTICGSCFCFNVCLSTLRVYKFTCIDMCVHVCEGQWSISQLVSHWTWNSLIQPDKMAGGSAGVPPIPSPKLSSFCWGMLRLLRVSCVSVWTLELLFLFLWSTRWRY